MTILCCSCLLGGVAEVVAWCNVEDDDNDDDGRS